MYEHCEEFEFPCVYFIRDGVGNIKIGTSNNVLKRLLTLQTANANKLTIHFVMKVETMNDAFDLEHEMHDMFRKNIVRGEWFKENNIIEFLTQPQIITEHYIFPGLNS